MIIVRLSDGLGNQMFQYAAARALALRRGVPLRLDLSAYQRDRKRVYGLGGLNILEAFVAEEEAARVITSPLDTARTWWAQPVVREPHFHFAPEIDQAPDSCYLSGYWQSERYFSHIADLLRLELTPKAPLAGANLDIARAMLVVDAVSLHIRRGDFLHEERVKALHGLCSPEYHQRAVAFIGERVAKPAFFIFTDEPDWVRDHLRFDFPAYLIAHNQTAPDEDLRLMSLCRHHIIANSSFSWWGAWLARRSGQIVCAPQRWFAGYAHDTRDLLPAHWHRLDG